jgi:hypothetical protein
MQLDAGDMNVKDIKAEDGNDSSIHARTYFALDTCIHEFYV